MTDIPNRPSTPDEPTTGAPTGQVEAGVRPATPRPTTPRTTEHPRREFFRRLGAGALAMTGMGWMVGRDRAQAAPSSAAGVGSTRRETLLEPRDWVETTAADTPVRFALIGAGGMGQNDMGMALRHPGTSIVAACDLYDSRLERCRERWGANLPVTRDYREVLRRRDVDAVIIATSDHWHQRIAIDALRAGKAVYLEKPIVQKVEEGRPLVEAWRASGRPLIVGSQRTSNLLYGKARDLVREGAIGTLNFAEAYWDRFSAIGAWQYTIPPNATERDIDWRRYRQGLPDKPFSADEFFRWRNYDDYGTGVTGDLFVHLFTGMHYMTDTIGPTRIHGTGGVRHWKDGRDAEDVLLGLYHYPERETHPEFTLSMRVNFAAGSGDSSVLRLVGSEGEISLGWSQVKLRKNRMSLRPGKSTGDFSAAVRQEVDEWYEVHHPEPAPSLIEPDEFVYRTPEGYSDGFEHFGNFLAAIREGAPVVQDPVFAMRAAAPAILTTVSARSGRTVGWNPETLETVPVG